MEKFVVKYLKYSLKIWYRLVVKFNDCSKVAKKKKKRAINYNKNKFKYAYICILRIVKPENTEIILNIKSSKIYAHIKTGSHLKNAIKISL